MNTPYWSLPTPNIDALIKHKKGSQMTDKKLEAHRVEEGVDTFIFTESELLDLLKQERNKVLDQLEADVKDTVTIFSETVPADPEWLPLSLLLKAIKKLRVDNTTDV